MNHTKGPAAYYLETGILGAYETAESIDDTEIDGQYAACFDDSLTILGSDFNRIQRDMMVDGKAFRICSMFRSAKSSTPTEGLLKLIDTDLEKEARQG